MNGATVKSYYRLTKPGIVYSNTIAAIAGYLYASKWMVDASTMLAVVIGVVTLIAASCVYNNFLDRHIDLKMKRTKNRAIVSGAISSKSALIFATVLLVIAFVALAFTNFLTLSLGVAACLSYVFIYGYFKRKTVYGTIIGSIPGALPPVAGYVAVTGTIDIDAIILFSILTLWQMPHFYAIAIFRMKDYSAAGIPVLSVVKGALTAKRHILGYAIVLAGIAPLLFVYGHAGYVYLVGSIVVTIAWVIIGVITYRNKDVIAWARKMFFYSLLVLLVLLGLISIASITP